MEDLNIQLEEEETRGRVFMEERRELLAEMTYSKAGDSLLIIDHTYVAESLKGQGIGRLLLDVIVAMTRRQGKKIIPLCPFAKSVFDKDPSIRDVLK
ncbi:GNAT family N-acetyltransferase [Lewinella sp. LCG006]|uniref:GNAT family N-acetyltransferase n=1 Tax=Lewinella sp. LCG006 TaxID=3231911 RepID=UPI00345F4562